VRARADWRFPTDIRFGAGRINEIASACRDCGVTRPLLVTDSGLAELPMTSAAAGRLAAAGLDVAVFADLEANPRGEDLDAGMSAFRAGAHNGVVAMGGGSAMDLAKLIGFMAGQDRPVWDFEDIDERWRRADPDAIAPVITVPTTAGTGSEINCSALLMRSDVHTRKTIFHPDMLPKIAICDPELTVSMPRAISAGSGLDTLVRCLEAYCSPDFHPMCDGIALEGVRLAIGNLANAYKKPKDMTSRTNMMAASIMGAVASQNGAGAMHLLSRQVSAIFGTHHGMTMAAVMPAVLEFNRPAIDGKINDLAHFSGIRGGFDGFSKHVVRLGKKLGVPAGLSKLGVTTEIIEHLVDMAMIDRSGDANPIPLNRDNIAALFHRCL
jgi:alcohol dehydrogenase class IV